MTRILDGKALAAEIRAEVAAGVADLVGSGGRPPGLAVILVGGDPASRIYVDSKAKACEEVGMLGRAVLEPAGLDQAGLLARVDELNRDDEIDGILVQLPLPRGLEERLVVERLLPEKDVDGFHPMNVGRLWIGEETFVSATPAGVIELLKRNGVPLAGRRAVVVGRSNIVGKPMAALLLAEHATVTVCHSRTPDLAAITRQADVLVAAIGRAGFVGPDHVKEGAVVVDVGINRIADPTEVERLFPGDEARRRRVAQGGSVVVGDVDYARVAPTAAAITPVPGGVGPLTVAMLLVNTLKAARRRQGR